MKMSTFVTWDGGFRAVPLSGHAPVSFQLSRVMLKIANLLEERIIYAIQNMLAMVSGHDWMCISSE